MCLTAFAKHVTPSSPSFSCLQLAMLFWSLSRAHPCCWVCSFTSLWVRSFLPAVEPLLSVLCRSFSLDLRLLCLCVSNPPFLSLSLLASCLWDRPSRSCSPCLLGLCRCLSVQLYAVVRSTRLACRSYGELFAHARADSFNSFTCCAWSAGLTSTTLSLPPRAARGGCVHAACA